MVVRRGGQPVHRAIACDAAKPMGDVVRGFRARLAEQGWEPLDRGAGREPPGFVLSFGTPAPRSSGCTPPSASE